MVSVLNVANPGDIPGVFEKREKDGMCTFWSEKERSLDSGIPYATVLSVAGLCDTLWSFSYAPGLFLGCYSLLPVPHFWVSGNINPSTFIGARNPGMSAL